LGGGHCMVFDDFNGVNKVSFHQPNESPDERAVFLDLEKILSGLV